MSKKRRAANKKNARKSTGPKTEAGKARSRLNAMKHGAYASVCLEGEDTGRFKMLALDLLAEYQPLGFEERLILQEIAETIWRKNRFKAAEGLTLHSYMFFNAGQAQQKGDVGFAMAQDAAAYGTIPRCLAAEALLDRRLWGLFDRLRQLQKRRGFYPLKSLPSPAGLHASTMKQAVAPAESSPGSTNGREPLESNGHSESGGGGSTPG